MFAAQFETFIGEKKAFPPGNAFENIVRNAI